MAGFLEYLGNLDKLKINAIKLSDKLKKAEFFG